VLGRASSPSRSAIFTTSESAGAWTPQVLKALIGARPTPELRLALLRKIRHEGQPIELVPEQMAPFLSTPPPGSEVDQLLITGAIQSGKSFLLAADLLTRIPWYPRGSEAWLAGPDYRQTRAERKYLEMWLPQLGWLDYRNSSLPKAENEPWLIATPFGVTIYGLSGRKPETLASVAPHYIGLCEAGQLLYETLTTARSRATMHSARLLAAGTVERAQPWYPRLVRRWLAPNPEGGRAYPLPAWINKRFYPGGRYDPKILAAERDLPPDVFQRRFAGMPAQPEGLVFPEVNPLVHGRVIRWGPRPPTAEPWELWLPRDLPLEVAIDPGYSGSAYAVLAIARWAPYQGIAVGEVHVRGMYHQQVIKACQGKWWWPQVTGGTIDVAGTYHQMGGEAASEVWALPVSKGGANLRLRGQKVPVWRGLDRCHEAFGVDPETGQPRFLIDFAECPRLAWELTEGYRHPLDNEGQVASEQPEDKRNDGAKALAYWLYDIYGEPGAEDHNDQYGLGPRVMLPWERDTEEDD
jgi:hypothetical protein